MPRIRPSPNQNWHGWINKKNHVGVEAAASAKLTVSPDHQERAIYVADGALGGHRVVRATTTGKVGYVDPSDAAQAHTALGLTTGAVADGALASVQFAGPITEPSWAWTPNLPIFVGAAGIPTQSPPSSGFHATVGVAVSATSMVIQLKSPIVL